MASRRSPGLMNPLDPRARAAMYYARKRRLARIAASNGDGGGGGGGPVESTQWRIVMSDKLNTTYIWAEQLIFRTTAAGAQQALDPSTGSATATSELASYGIELAFDDTDTTNGWSSAANPSEPVIVEFTFDSAKTIVEFEFNFFSSTYGVGTYAIEAYVDDAWVEVFAETGLDTGAFPSGNRTVEVQSI